MSPEVLVVLGSKSDAEVGKKITAMLDDFEIDYSIAIASAHRTPDHLRELVRNSDASVFIAVAGLSAALPGAIAANTTRPVIGVPVSGKVNLDSILSIIQMPPGVPVAAVGLDRGENAALLAIQILSIGNKELAERLREHRRQLGEWVLEDNKSLGE